MSLLEQPPDSAERAQMCACLLVSRAATGGSAGDLTEAQGALLAGHTATGKQSQTIPQCCVQTCPIQHYMQRTSGRRVSSVTSAQRSHFCET